MTIVEGEIWDTIGQVQLLLISTNAIVTRRRFDGSGGELVMGRGLALEAKVRYPRLPRALGILIEAAIDRPGGQYPVLISPISERGTTLGAFQVKRHWGAPADLALIRASCLSLAALAPQWPTIAMNYPGIGNGRLDEASVQPVLEELLGPVPGLTIYRKAPAEPPSRRSPLFRDREFSRADPSGPLKKPRGRSDVEEERGAH